MSAGELLAIQGLEVGKSKFTQVRLERRVAEILRQIQVHEKLPTSELVEKMIVAYAEKYHPEWSLKFVPSENQPTRRRRRSDATEADSPPGS